MQFPNEVREQLIALAEYKIIEKADTKIFSQGELSENYYIIVRGTVKIE
jgi:CRP-like cAMP-binding protein